MEESAEGIVGMRQAKLVRHSKPKGGATDRPSRKAEDRRPERFPARGLKERSSDLSWNHGTASGESIGREPGDWDETGVGSTREHAPVGTGYPPMRIFRSDSICRTAVYVIRSYGGVGGGSRKASLYPKYSSVSAKIEPNPILSENVAKNRARNPSRL